MKFSVNIFIFAVGVIQHMGARKVYQIEQRHQMSNNENITNWHCASGESIALTELCDGYRQCGDGSDETIETCIGIYCPEYAFRCAYGACIQGNMRCNGYQDCADNSDEANFLCEERDFEILQVQWQGECKIPDTIQCVESSECLPTEKMCNGVRDCIDGSDEKVELCSYIYCPPYAFRCGYGACVPGVSLCNGVRDCLDSSDELAAICDIKMQANKFVNIANSTIDRNPQSLAAEDQSKTQHYNGCVMLYDQRNLIAVHTATKTIIRPGTRLLNGTKVNFVCTSSWRVNDDGIIQCLGSVWSKKLPHCSQNCSGNAITRGISTQSSCNFKDKSLNCSQDYLPIGTKAHVSCAPGYHIDSADDPSNILTCDQDAEWNYPKLKCTPICGRTHKIDQLSDHAWDISIYRRSTIPSFEFACRGVIISPKLVLSAANCLISNRKIPTQNRDTTYYNVLEHEPWPERYDIEKVEEIFRSRLHNISEIALPNAMDNATLDDQVAVFILVKHFHFSSKLSPICLYVNQLTVYQQPLMILPVRSAGRIELLLGTSISYENQSVSLEKLHYLNGIIGEAPVGGNYKLLLVNYYNDFLTRQLWRYYYLL